MPKVDKSQILLGEVYNHYRSITQDPVDYKQHKEVLDLWGEKVVEALLLGKDVKLHGGLATLGIRKKLKRTYIDKKASKELGREVRRSNSHSNFYGAKVHWRRHYTTFNSSGWVFNPSRALQRGLSAVMKTPKGHTVYLQRAMATSKKNQSRSIYVKKVIGL